MKTLFMLICFVVVLPVYAGGMYEVPVQLLELDHQGRVEFLQNAIAATDLGNEQTLRYKDFRTIVVGGDERGSDFKGALFIYSVKIDSRENGYRVFHCSQFLAVGNLDQKYTRQIDCKKI